MGMPRFIMIVVAFCACPAFCDETFDKLFSAGKYKEAIDYADRKIAPASRDAAMWVKVAEANEKAGRIEKALASYMVSWRMNPNDYASLLGAARIYNKLEQYDEAENMAKKALDQQFTAEASWEYAMACIELKRPAEAKKALEKVIETDPGNAVANRELGKIYKNDMKVALKEIKTKSDLTDTKSGVDNLSASEKPITENPKAKLINIAVMDLNTTSGLVHSEILLLTDKLINSLVKGGFTVIERGMRDEILKEMGFQQSGACSESSCLVEVGQLLGVHKMIGGTIGKFGSAYVIEFRLIDVGTGKIDDSFSGKYQGDISNLLYGVNDAVDSFLINLK